jgi:hypothetical protein
MSAPYWKEEIMTVRQATSGLKRARAALAPAMVLLSSAAFLAMPATANAQESVAANAESARQVVKRMSDYMASQANLTVKFDVDIDIITPAIEKIQFAASGSLVLSRPNKVHLTRIGGFTEVELISDGTTLTILEPSSREFSQMTSPGDVDAVIGMLRTDYYVEMPGADILLTNGYDNLMANVLEAKHIGIGVIDNVECEHLAFRNADTDWQLWVRTGDRPLPCKYIISSKTVAGSPDYTITFSDWATPASIPASAFSFAPRDGGQPVPFEQLTAIGELPSATPFSGGE